MMKVKSFLLILGIAAIAAAQMPVANAQLEERTRGANAGWAAIARSGNTPPAEPADPQLEPAQDLDIASKAQDVDSKKRIVGTWVMTVSPIGAPGFNSLQTYNDDGTMTETSSHLAQLASGPAHGVWEGKKSDYAVTFELFAFDPAGQAVGRIRVRSKIRFGNDDTLTADGAVDFIQPDGTVIPNIASTPFTGRRIKVLPAN
jgi:hypothetical protein